jgi:2'-5' RNA ligase
MTRAFVAVRLPDAVLDALEELVSGLDISGRPTTRDQWHLTLQFLGDDVDVGPVVSALEGIDVAGGRVRLGGAGAFHAVDAANVLWLGLAEGSDFIARLAEAVAARTAPLGVERSARSFRPHLTLARFRARTDVADLIEAIGDAPVGPEWPVDEISVYASELHPEGARYFEQATIRLPE